jgi:hypothetical protein
MIAMFIIRMALGHETENVVMPQKRTDYLDRLNRAAIEPYEYAAPHLCRVYRDDVKKALALIKRLNAKIDKQAAKIDRLKSTVKGGQ